MKTHIQNLTLTILLVIPIAISAQNQDSLKSKKWIITTSLFDYFPNGFNASNINLGTEIYFKNQKSLSINVGFLKSHGPVGRYDYFQLYSLNSQGVKVQIECKHYLKKWRLFEPAMLIFWPHIFQYRSQKLNNSGYYLASNLIFQTTEIQREEQIPAASLNAGPGVKNNYSVYRAVYACTVKFGYQCIKKYGLTIDYAIGLGFQYISSYSKNKIGTNEYWANAETDWPWAKKFDNGKGIYPKFVYEIKLGWAF